METPLSPKENEDLLNRISTLASKAGHLANKIYLDEDAIDEEIRNHTHSLREILGIALVLSERLARENDNESMVTLRDQGKGPGEARFPVALDEMGVDDLEMQ